MSAALVAALVLAPVVLLAQKRSFDFVSKTANFAAFKTFALKDGTKVGDPRRLPDRRRHQIRAGREGLTESAAKPDLTVVYHVAFDKKQDITAYNTGGGVGTGGVGDLARPMCG